MFTIVQMRKDTWPGLWIVLIAPSSGARVEVGFSNNSSAVTRVSALFRSYSKVIFWASRSAKGSPEGIDTTPIQAITDEAIELGTRRI